MPSFAYKAVDGMGKMCRGSVFAFNPTDVEERLSENGLTLVQVKKVREGGWIQVLFGPPKIRARALIEFYHRLAQTLDLGLPILAALDENAKVLPSAPLRKMIREIKVTIEGGATLFEALRRFPKTFQKFELSVVKMGEQSGVLPASLRNLAEFLEWKDEIRSLVKRATIYPAFILVAITGVIGVWVGYVLPQMAKVLVEMGVELPALTRGVMAVSSFLRLHWAGMLGLSIAILIGVTLTLRHKRGRVLLHQVFLHMPIAGNVAKSIALSRMTRNFATMYESGMNMKTIFGILTDDVLGNKYLEEELAHAYTAIEQGKSIADAIESTGAFPPLLLGAIRNGESTGTLGDVLARLSEYYDVEVKKTVDTLLSALEPLVIVALGTVFGVIILSILLPLYGVVGEMGQSY
jgi:type IV pilus assembly protein PilC